MSDTLQLVVDSTDAQLHYNESINSCVFLLRWGFGSTTTSWSVSDIRWVIPIWLSGDEDDDKLKRIGHSLSAFNVEANSGTVSLRNTDDKLKKRSDIHSAIPT